MLEPNIIGQGFLTSIGLIISIGAQNVHVLRFGIMRCHIISICSICILCDFLLMSLGVIGFAAWLQANKLWLFIFTIGGIVFILCYGAAAFIAFFNSKHVQKVDIPQLQYTRAKAVLMTFSVTFLNPHVYLDTVILLGSIGSTYEGAARFSFLFGALFASLFWFSILGYGSYKLANFFRLPQVWRYLELVIGIIMFWVAWHMISFILQQY